MSFLNKFLSSVTSNPKPSGVVGIDIGSSSIKVVELEEKKGVVSLNTYGEVQLGPYADKQIGEPVTLDATKEQEALVDVIRESVVKSRDSVFAMSLSSSFVTNVSLKSESEEDMGSMVRVEARKVIPASLSEVTLDWAEIEMTEKEAEAYDDDKHKNVLIAAIQNAALERYKVLMKFAGFPEPPTEIECFSSIRALYNTDEPDIAILDIGAVSAKVYIIHNGILMRMYRIRAGGSIATKQIADALKMDFQAAEEIKIQADKNSGTFADMKRAHDASYGRPFREFSQVIRDYEQKTGIKITTVYLSGGATLFPGMDSSVKSVFNKDVVIANPFSKVAYPSFMEDTMLEIGPSFTPALGAAMRAFE